jgi:small subunit ribosomal protein S7
MKHGKKSVARRIVSDALRHIQEQLQKNPRMILGEAIEKVEPLFKVVGTKRGAKSIQTPKPLNERQRRRTAILWIVEAADKRHKKDSMGVRIAKEVLAILEDDSSALQKRNQVHRTALLNRSNVVLVDRKVMRFS